MEQDALAVSTGLQKPYISPEVHRCYETYRFYNITDLQALYDFSVDQSRTISVPGPTRARTRATTRSIAAAQECCIYSFPRAHTRGAAGGSFVHVVQECCQLVAAAPACGVVGRLGHAHARMHKKLILEQKVPIFCIRPGGAAWNRKAWRWRGSAGSSTHGGGRSVNFLTGIGRLSKSSRSFYGLPAVGAAATRS